MVDSFAELLVDAYVSDAAREEFFSAVFDRSYALGLFLYNGRSDASDSAADLAQDVSLKVFEKYFVPRRLSAYDNIGGLVNTIAYNSFVNEYRVSARFPTDSIDALDTDILPLYADFLGRLEAGDVLSLLDDDDVGLRLLKENLEGYKYVELAKEYGLNLSMVKSMIFRARNAARESLSDEYQE